MSEDLEQILRNKLARREAERQQLIDDVRAKNEARSASRMGVMREEVLARMEQRKHDATNLAHEAGHRIATERQNSAHAGYNAQADFAREAAKNANSFGDAAFKLRQKKLADSGRD